VVLGNRHGKTKNLPRICMGASFACRTGGAFPRGHAIRLGALRVLVGQCANREDRLAPPAGYP